jgi:hypothetical protein
MTKFFLIRILNCKLRYIRPLSEKKEASFSRRHINCFNNSITSFSSIFVRLYQVLILDSIFLDVFTPACSHDKMSASVHFSHQKSDCCEELNITEDFNSFFDITWRCRPKLYISVICKFDIIFVKDQHEDAHCQGNDS